jgi:hypothetical protein
MSEDAVVAVIDTLERLGVPYMVVGSLSCNVYAIPRSTQDADFVVQLDAERAGPLLAALRASFQIEPQMSFETITATTRFEIESRATGFKIELFLLSDDPHDQARFARRRELAIAGRRAWVPAAEDVIVTILRWSRAGRRAKDVDDVKNVVAAQQNALDWNYIHHWCDQHGTRALLEDVRRSIPKLD